jgi:predicted nucleotidyltransferase
MELLTRDERKFILAIEVLEFSGRERRRGGRGDEKSLMATITDAKIVSKEIVRALNPVSISLFGSCAKYGFGEDLDLLIIVDVDDMESSFKTNLILHKCLKRYYKDFAVDPFVISASLFRGYYLQGSPFLKLILREGRPLYMRGILEESFKQAEDELNMAVYLLNGGFFRGSCLHSQQSIEKSIKARLLKTAG